MKKVDVELDGNDEVAKMILEIFAGKDGAQNVANLVLAKTDMKSKIYDKAFTNALKKLRPNWFK